MSWTASRLTNSPSRLPSGRQARHRVRGRLEVRHLQGPQLGRAAGNARNYVEYVERAIGCHIGYVSVGAERDSLIIR